MLRYDGDNFEEDVVPSEDDAHDLLPTSLDQEFQLSELSRYHNNTHHSPAKVRMPSEMQVRQSRKNMHECIDYIINNGEISENPKVAEIWEDLERVIQEKQVLVRNLILSSGTKTDGNGVVWPALTSKKRSVMKRYKGVTG